MADFAISNITISNNRLVIGDTVTIGFTLKNTMGSSYTLESVTFWLRAEATNNPAAARLTYNEPVSIANGKSKKFSYTVTLEEQLYLSLTALQTALNASTAVRALPLMVNLTGQYVVSGSSTQYGIGFEFDIPDAYIMRSRCQPAIQSFSLERALNGVPNDEGTSVLTTMKLAMADTSESSNMRLTMYYVSGDNDATTSNSSINLTSEISTLLSGVTDSTTLIPSTFSNGSEWNYLLVFGDAYESTTARFSVPRSFANVHLSGASTGGVCFGGFGSSTEGNPKTESYYPIHPYAGITPVSGGVYEQVLNFDTDASFTEHDGGNGFKPTLRCFGHTIELHGEIQPTKSLTDDTAYYPICTIPEQYAPVSDVMSIQQGTSQALWLLRVFNRFHSESPGKVTLARYRLGGSWTDVPAGAWLPFHTMWNIDGIVAGDGTVSTAVLQDSTGSDIEDADGYQVTVASSASTVQLDHTAAQVDQAIEYANELYIAYIAGDLNGKTPVRGEDYWTSADKAEIVADVIAALPMYAGEVESV